MRFSYPIIPIPEQPTLLSESVPERNGHIFGTHDPAASVRSCFQALQKMITLRYMYAEAAHDKLLQLVIIAIITDTIFGILRAIKDRNFNSCFGINGAIRKCAMILSIILLVIVDYITQFNLIGFLPEEVRQFFGESIGIAGFFEILFLTYEVVSILKNMVLCGLPVKKIWSYVRTFLSKYTDELPDDDELADTASKAEVSNEKYIS